MLSWSFTYCESFKEGAGEIAAAYGKNIISQEDCAYHLNSGGSVSPAQKANLGLEVYVNHH